MSEYNLGTASGRIVVDGSGASKGFEVAQVAGNAFFNTIKNRVNEVQAFGRKLAVAGATGAIGLGLAVKSAANFEQQMSAVAAVTNASGKTFDALREKALQLGADTVFSATEAAGAIEELAKAGISTKDILTGAADATTALAAAGGVALPEAATIAANAMNQFNLSGRDVTKVADLLAGAAATSAADVSTLGQSLSQVGAVANTVGLNLDDTVIALGELADAGIKGSDAGTSLKTMLLNLIPTTDRQVAKMKELNLLTFSGAKANKILADKGIKPLGKSYQDVRKSIEQYLVQQGVAKTGTAKLKTETDKFIKSQGVLRNEFFNTKGELKPLREIQDILSKSMKNMTKEQKLATLELLFGQDAIRASAVLTNEGAKGFDKFSKAMKGTTAAEIAAKRLDNLKGAGEQLSGALETLRIKLGTPLLRPLTMLTRALAGFISWLGKAPKWVFVIASALLVMASAFAIIVGVGLALLPVLLAMAANFVALFIVRSLAAPFIAFGRALIFQRSAAAASAAANAALQKSMLRVGIMGKVAALGIKALTIAVRLLAFAFSGPGLIIIGLIALLVILYKRNEAFRNLVNRVAAAIKGGLVSAFNAVKGVIGSVVGYFQKLGDIFQSKVLPVIQQVAAQLQGKLIAGFQKLSAQVGSTLVPAIQKLMAVFSGIAGSPFGQKLAEWGGQAAAFGAKILPMLAKVGAFFVGTILPVLVKVVGFFGGIFIDTVVQAISGIIQVITGLVTFITGIFNVIKGILTGDWSLMWTGMKQIVSGLLQGIIGVIKTYLAVGVLKIFKLAFIGIKAIVVAGWGLVRGLFTRSVSGIVNGVKSLFGSKIAQIFLLPFRLIIAGIKLYFTIIKTVIQTAMTVIMAVLRVGWQVAVTVVRTVFNLIKTVIMTAFNVIKAVIQGAIAVIKAIFSGNFSAIAGIVRGVMGRIGAAIRGGINKARAIFGAAVSAIRGIASSVFGSLKGIVSRAMTALVGAIKGAVSKAKAAFNKVKDGIVGVAKNFGTLLKNAGGKLISGLARGITDKLGDAKRAAMKVASAIKGAFGGSPVEYGPLLKWNRGRIGKQLIQTLAKGIESETETAKKAVAKVAGAIADPTATMRFAIADDASKTLERMVTAGITPPSFDAGPGSSRKPPKGPDFPTAFRLVDGKITFKGDKKYINGILVEAKEDDDEFDKTIGRMG